MKKVIFLAAAALGMGVSTANAQDISYGTKVGANYTLVSTHFKVGERPEDYEDPNGVGYHFGGFLNYSVSGNFAIRPELLISARNMKSSSSSRIEESGTVVKVEIDANSTNTFIEIPILASFGNQESGIQFQAGPSVNILAGVRTRATIKTTLNGDTMEVETQETGSEAKEGQRPLDLGLAAGAVYQTEGGFHIGLRYQRGLTSVNDDNTDLYVSNYNVIQLSLGWTFGR